MIPVRALATVVAFACIAAGPARAGEDAVCEPRVEEHARSHSARVRVHRDAFTDCHLDEAGYRQLVGGWIAARDPALPAPRSVGLGRIVGHPWIGLYLARAALDHPAWDPATGRAVGMHVNEAVRRLLSAPAFLARLRRPFADAGFDVVGVSVEKVLVDEARAVLGAAAPPRRRVPFDAQLWLVLAVPQ